MAFASTVPVRRGWRMFVMLSPAVLESSAGRRVGAAGVAGAVASIVIESVAPAGLALPAASIA
ncbi:MAG: hypothetical protein U0794_06380 [Isosphaeraceae bacterium]